MSRNAEMSTGTQDPSSEITGSARMAVAVIGPNAAHRRVVAKALTGSEARTVREFIDYPTKLTDIQRLMEQQHFDVVMIDVDSDQSYSLQVVQKFAALENVMVMVYSRRNDQGLLRSCLEAGARDFLPLPADAIAEAERAISMPPQEPVRPVAPAPASAMPSVSSVPEPVRASQPISPIDILRPPSPPETPATPPSPPIDILKTPVSASDETARVFPASQPEISRPVAVPAQEMMYPVSPATQELSRIPEPAPRATGPIPAPSLLAIESRGMPPQFDAAKMPEPVAAQTADPAQTDFTAWDNAWIRAAAQPGEPGTVEAKAKPTPPVPAVKAKTGRLIGGPQKVWPAPARIDGAPEAPVFRGAETPAVHEANGPDWKKWAIIAAVPAAIISVLLVVFLRPSRPAASAGVPSPPTVSAPAPDPSPSSTEPETQAAPPIAKPSPATVQNPPSAPETPTTPAVSVAPDMMNAQLSAPTRISAAIKKPAPVEEQPPAGFSPGALDSGGSVSGSIFTGAGSVKVVPSVSAISAGVAEGMLLHKSAPMYPQFAREAHMGGTVLLGATISAAGTIEGLHVISGPEIFRAPAVEAVKTWRYRPYKLNNRPVDVQTTIRVIFAADSH
jgi:periplasmic protein TonB